MTAKVIVHRNLLFVPNETYIGAQVSALRRYRPLLSGLRIDRRAVARPECERAVLEELVSPRRAHLLEWSMKILRLPPPPLVRRLRDFEADLLHVHFGGDAFWSLPVARSLTIPLVVTFHGYDVNQRRGSSAAAFAYSALRPRVFRTATRVIAVSDFLEGRLIEEGCPREKIIRHYIGVDTIAFTRERPPDERPTIAFVARLVDFKGCDLLFDAVARLPIAKDVKLMVVGTGPEEAPLRFHASQLGLDVEFAGAAAPAAVKAILERAHLFCLPTFPSKEGHVESLSLAVLEAQSMGLPVVATRVGGLPEAVRDGETGMLVAPRDVEALSSALGTLLADETRRKAMAAAARAHVVNTFDLTRQTALLESIYDDVTGRG